MNRSVKGLQANLTPQTVEATSRDTIFALSSGALPSGVAVIRASGPRVRFALETIAGMVPPPKLAALRSFRSSENLLDRGLTLFFPKPESFSGEDCCEFHVHGGRAVVSAMLEALGRLEAFRGAEAGEFALRAFLNGKLDLTEAEGLADLIDAATETQRRMALANAGGAQRTLYEKWRSEIIHCRAMIEAELDFSDESDIPGSVSDRIWPLVSALRDEIEDHINGFARAELIREGMQVVILGAPNAGKSSLLNALARRDVAIVSEEPGTTRDLIDVALDLHGTKVNLTDTAGVRPAGAAKVEAIGIERALARAAQADLLLYIEDVAAPQSLELPPGIPALRIGAKDDLPSLNGGRYDLRVSSKTGAGMDQLLSRLAEHASGLAGPIEDVLPSRLRHVQLLTACVDRMKAAAANGVSLELRAEELRSAGEALGRIVGATGAEDLLDVIFSKFCIGK